jgi:hypothetical protein
MEHLGEIFRHLCLKEIQIEMYASDWLFALFSNIIPLREYHHFLDGFFAEGWPFFYKFSLTFLKGMKNSILETEDQSELITLIKLKHVIASI